MAQSKLDEVSGSDLGLLSRACGIPLHLYRRPHVEQCIRRSLMRNGVPDSAGLGERLRRDPLACKAFRRSVLVGVTSPFRDPEEFEVLERRVLPALVDQKSRLNVWSAGCSTGEELRSVANLLDRLGVPPPTWLLGSDALEEAVERAQDNQKEFPERLRASVRFELRDLITDPLPARRFALVLCRNVAIYLEAAAQQRLHRNLVDALHTGGYLMLGRSETLVHPEALGLAPHSRHLFQKVAT